jgi:hypothetical protein
LNGPKKKTSRKKRTEIYTVGEINQLIDSIVHPLVKTHLAFTLLDEAFHMLVERNPQESTVKFVKYTLPGIIKKLLEENQ